MKLSIIIFADILHFMPLKVVTPEGSSIAIHSSQDFERILKVRYLSQLKFSDVKISKNIQKRCTKALVKKWITPRQIWLGRYYAEDIRGTLQLDLTIAWIDKRIGFGVWTNRDIPMHTFIGEYTGLLRKRKFWGRWKNLYCCDYSIGRGRSTSIVIDSQDFGNHTRFINHSIHPNVQLVSVYCDRMIHVILHTIGEISAGTQLCCDYGEDYWAERGEPIEL